MAHVSLYRRYRPDTFDKIIGQDHIVHTLVNQIKGDNISHAYLFTGTRGTGKTSVARIFARAINCQNQINGSPCGECRTCVELMNPNNMDIIEIDAASNSTVDEIRDLREKVKYPPVVGKYKVYIVDEVHMLSTNAFNALLKTLEEPPSHAVFILATTDVHKLPATILSRCMRFDFKLLSIPELAGNLKAIFDDIGKSYSEEAVNLIATAAEGSARDSLSIADMCVSFSDKEITYRDVLEVLGAADPNIIIDLLSAIIKKDTSSALGIVDNLCKFGGNIAVVAKDLAAYVRNALYIKTCADAEKLLRLPSDLFNRLKEIEKDATATRLLDILNLINGLSGELRYSNQPRIIFEAAVIRAAVECGNADLESRLARLEAKLAGGVEIIQKKTTIKSPDVAELWSRCGQELVVQERFFALSIPMSRCAEISAEGNNVINVHYKNESDAALVRMPDNVKAIEGKLFEISGIKYKLRITLDEVDTSGVNAAEKLKNIFGSDFKVTK